MTRDDMARVLVGYYGGINRLDAHVALADCSRDFTFENVLAGMTVHGRDAVARYYRELFVTFPAYALRIDGCAFGDNVAAAWGVWRGAPDGAAVRLVSILEFRDGELRADRNYPDVIGFCAATGVPLESITAARA